MTARLTPDGLPIVSKETTEVYARDHNRRVSEGTFENFAREECTKLLNENPEIVDCIRRVYPGQVEKATTALVGISYAYELLRRQAEANKMEEEAQ